MPDFIERKATVNKIVEIGNQNYQGKYPNIGMAHAANIVNCMPAADVAPVVHARWESVEDFDGDGHWMCTNCGVEWVFNDGSPEENEAYYCPRCGAKMDGHTTPGPSHGSATESEV